MALVHAEEHLSDDEIFFGKLSLKELKKHILWNKNPPPKIPEYTHQTSSHNQSLNIKTESDDHNTSVKILESHSQPNLRSPKHDLSRHSSEFESPSMRPSDVSFLKLENMVENLCVSSSVEKNAELNNTLDVINYILNNGPECKLEDKVKVEHEDIVKQFSNEEKHVKSPLQTASSPSKLTCKTLKNIKDSPSSCYATPIKMESQTPCKASIFKTPLAKTEVKKDVFKTPSTSIKSRTPAFKTPTPQSQIKPPTSSLKKITSKAHSYEHISSPIASYIKNCPQVPLVKDVHPRKPLPGPSSIPKFTKALPKNRMENKENVHLPSVAYKSAKKTKVIEVPDKEKLPQSQWVKKMTSTLPKPVVMKHNHREMNIAKRSLMQEDSFADLPYRQAEVSVCTQKTAFKLNKNT